MNKGNPLKNKINNNRFKIISKVIVNIKKIKVI